MAPKSVARAGQSALKVVAGTWFDPEPEQAAEVTELQVTRQLPDGAGRYRVEWVPERDQCLGIFELSLQAPLQVPDCRPIDRVVLHVGVTGSSATRIDGLSSPGPQQSGEVVLVAPNTSRRRDVVFGQPGPNRFVQVLLPVAGFLALAGDLGWELDDRQLDRLRAGEGRILHRGPASPRLLVVAEQILTAPYSGRLRQAYLRAKTHELLAVYVGSFTESAAPGTTVPRLQPEVAAGVARARQLLLDDLGNAPSIAPLARRVGLGESTLRQAFRQRYGETVHSFVTRSRLELARERIVKDPWRNLGDIAGSVGIHSASRFSALFWEHYGVLPSSWRAACRQQTQLTSETSAAGS